MNNSSCFSNKRKRKGEEEESTQVTQPSKRSRMVSLVKKVGQGLRDKIAVAAKALASRTYTQDIKSKLFTTPAGPLRNVFMLGAWGIMRANGGYVMRTAFRRAPHAYCWVVFK